MRNKANSISWLLLTGALVMAGCRERNQYVEPPPPEVTVAYPVRKMVQEHYETTGQTRAVKTVVLKARVDGYLQEIGFKDGDLVQQGQVLYVIDPAPYEAEVASAEAALEKANAQYRLAQQNLKRTRELASKKVATASELDVQEAEVATSKADVGAAKARLREAKLDLSYTKITAPFSGRIGEHMVDIGNLIQTGETTLATIESTDPIDAYFTVSESDLLRFMELKKEGKIKISEADPLKIELALGNTENFAFQGTLDFREFGVDPETGTTERRAVFENKDGGLIPGLFVRVRAKVGDPSSQLLVPEEAISSDQRGDFLRIVNDQKTVEHRVVKTGILVDGMRVIEEGLQPHDLVVVVGLQRAQAGRKVTYKKPENSPPAAQPETETQAKNPPNKGTTETGDESTPAKKADRD